MRDFFGASDRAAEAARRRDVTSKGKGKVKDNDNVLQSFGSFAGKASRNPEDITVRVMHQSELGRRHQDKQRKPEVDQSSQSYDPRVSRLDQYMHGKWKQEELARRENHKTIFRHHENGPQRSTHEKAFGDVKKYAATDINLENARRNAFGHKVTKIEQDMKQRDSKSNAIIEQWHQAGGAVGGTPIADSSSRGLYRPNETTREAYDMSIAGLTKRLSDLKTMARHIEIEQQTRDNFDQKILNMYKQQVKVVASKETNQLLKTEQTRRQRFNNQFEINYVERLDTILKDREARKIHAANQHLAKKIEYYRREEAKLDKQIKQSFGR
jgi:hypothetical protein